MKNFFLLLTPILLLLSACHQEEIYRPNCKLTTLQKEDGTNYLSFIYNNNLIEKAIFADDETFLFEYNKDKTVKAIYNYLNDSLYSFVTMTYDKKHLSQIDYYLIYNQDSLFTQQKLFIRNKDGLYGIKNYALTDNYLNFQPRIENCHLYQLFFPIIEQKYYNQNEEKEELQLIYQSNITFSQENVTEIVTTYNNGFVFTNSMTYDDAKSPFFGMTFAFTDLFSCPFDAICNYSSNNIVTYSYTESSLFSEDFINHYYYQYNNKNYPIDLFQIKGNDTILLWHFIYDK